MPSDPTKLLKRPGSDGKHLRNLKKTIKTLKYHRTYEKLRCACVCGNNNNKPVIHIVHTQARSVFIALIARTRHGHHTKDERINNTTLMANKRQV